jgi:hypothetical protein
MISRAEGPTMLTAEVGPASRATGATAASQGDQPHLEHIDCLPTYGASDTVSTTRNAPATALTDHGGGDGADYAAPTHGDHKSAALSLRTPAQSKATTKGQMTMKAREDAVKDLQETEVSTTDRDLLAAVDALRVVTDSPRLRESEREMLESTARFLESTVAPWLIEDRKAVA